MTKQPIGATPAWTEAQICAALCRQTFASRCIVLVDNCNWTRHEADVLGVTTDRRLIDVEVKISRADFRADAKKEKWWKKEQWWHQRGEPTGIRREWPPRVWKHYYALPAELWTDELIEQAGSPRSGILLLARRRDGRLSVTCRRRAQPCRDAYRLTDDQVLDIARLANLRMWDARLYADSEAAVQP